MEHWNRSDSSSEDSILWTFYLILEVKIYQTLLLGIISK